MTEIYHVLAIVNDDGGLNHYLGQNGDEEVFCFNLDDPMIHVFASQEEADAELVTQRRYWEDKVRALPIHRDNLDVAALPI